MEAVQKRHIFSTYSTPGLAYAVVDHGGGTTGGAGAVDAQLSKVLLGNGVNASLFLRQPRCSLNITYTFFIIMATENFVHRFGAYILRGLSA